MTAPIWTDQQVLNQLLHGSSWNTDVLRYAFPATASQVQTPGDEAAGFVPLNGAQQAMASLGMALWADLIALPVAQSAPEQANIRFGLTSTDIEFAHAYYPAQGSVWFNAGEQDLLEPAVGNYGFSTYVHEIGHALGLDHMGDYDGEGDWQPSSYQDSVVYSIMSYFGPEAGTGEGQVAWGNWFNAGGVLVSQQTPMINDIMAIQQLYGASSARAENTVYGFGSNAGGTTGWLYDFTRNTDPVLAIYDSGGTDTLDLSGWGTASSVDLTPGSFSSVNGMTSNLSLARNTVIENAITGAGNDTVVGNAADNTLRTGAGDDILRGGAGDDTLDGGLGNDTALYAANWQQYHVGFDVAAGAHRVTDRSGAEGTDALYSIEQGQFDGQVLGMNDLTSSVFRFFNTSSGSHFYTSSVDEASHVYATMPGMQYEGVVYDRAMQGGNTIDVFRFYNTANNSHFYTASAQEADTIMGTLPEYRFEGVAYQARAAADDDLQGVHRFYNTGAATHFYTASDAEAQSVINELSDYFQYEGIAFYADVFAMA